MSLPQMMSCHVVLRLQKTKETKEETNLFATNNGQTKDNKKISGFLKRPSAKNYGTNSSEPYELKYIFSISNIYLLLKQNKARVTQSHEFRYKSFML